MSGFFIPTDLHHTPHNTGTTLWKRIHATLVRWLREICIDWMQVLTNTGTRLLHKFQVHPKILCDLLLEGIDWELWTLINVKLRDCPFVLKWFVDLFLYWVRSRTLFKDVIITRYFFVRYLMDFLADSSYLSENWISRLGVLVNTGSETWIFAPLVLMGLTLSIVTLLLTIFSHSSTTC